MKIKHLPMLVLPLVSLCTAAHAGHWDPDLQPTKPSLTVAAVNSTGTNTSVWMTDAQGYSKQATYSWNWVRDFPGEDPPAMYGQHTIAWTGGNYTASYQGNNPADFAGISTNFAADISSDYAVDFDVITPAIIVGANDGNNPAADTLNAGGTLLHIRLAPNGNDNLSFRVGLELATSYSYSATTSATVTGPQVKVETTNAVLGNT